MNILDIRSNLPELCNETPSIESTPLYTGVLLKFKVPVLDRKTLGIYKGYIRYDTTKPCYRDPSRNLEKMLVHTAFQYDDRNAPGGPRPMGYLACMVPDSLHPDIAPCESTIANRRKILVPGRSLQVPLWVFTLDGRRVQPTSRHYYLPYLK